MSSAEGHSGRAERLSLQGRAMSVMSGRRRGGSTCGPRVGDLVTAGGSRETRDTPARRVHEQFDEGLEEVQRRLAVLGADLF